MDDFQNGFLLIVEGSSFVIVFNRKKVDLPPLTNKVIISFEIKNTLALGPGLLVLILKKRVLYHRIST